MNILTLENITKVFTERKVFDQTNFYMEDGEKIGVIGINGTGKSTLLKVIAGLCEVDDGKVIRAGGQVIRYLPQIPDFDAERTVIESVLHDNREQTELWNKESDAKSMLTTLGITNFYQKMGELSGGQRKRIALVAALLAPADILLLDEPTKGFDAEFKVTFANIIDNLTTQGITVLMVSHDVTFCAEYAHRCGLFFDGNIVAEGTPREFFSGNSFYTTPANRMARHVIPEAITVEDIITCCGGTVKEKRHTINETLPLPEPPPRSVNFKPQPLKLWRKILALVAGLVAFGVFLYATSITDLSAFVNVSGISSEGKEQLSLYVVLFVALSVFLLAIGRRSEPPLVVQTPKEKRNLSKRTIVASISILLFIPLTIFAGIFYMNDRQYNLVALLVLVECMLPFVLVFEGRKPKARELVTIAVLCAIGIAGRSLFFMLPQFKPILALTIIAGVAFGGETGFLVGAVTMLASNMLFSQGPWTPWQMFAMGIIGFLAGVLFKKGWLRRTRVSLAVFGAFTAIIIYGGIMNPAAAFMVSAESITLKTLFAYYITGLPMDLVHAFGTALFIMIAAEPMLEKMDRIKVKYGLVE